MVQKLHKLDGKKRRRNIHVLVLILAFERGTFLCAGGATTCASLHLGEIRPGKLRGNHRHHDCNETFVIWGAATKFRVRFFVGLDSWQDIIPK